MRFFATCAKGTEGALRRELAALRLRGVRGERGGVGFDGELEAGMRACLHSRVAMRVLLQLASFPANDATSLYDGARAVDWTEWLTARSTLAVEATVRDSGVTHSGFAAGGPSGRSSGIDLHPRRSPAGLEGALHGLHETLFDGAIACSPPIGDGHERIAEHLHDFEGALREQGGEGSLREPLSVRKAEQVIVRENAHGNPQGTPPTLKSPAKRRQSRRRIILLPVAFSEAGDHL
jgi:hypothetical protein